MRVVVTGATGAIGVAFIEELVRQQAEVLVILRSNSPRAGRVPVAPGVKVLQLDMEDYASYNPGPVVEPYDTFVHMAWQGTTGADRENEQLQSCNVKHSLEAVELARRFGCSTFLFVGSQAEYGRVEGVLKPDTPTHPESRYGMAKLAAGKKTEHKCTQLGMKHVWVRVLSVYGPGDSERSMLITAIRKMLAGEKALFTAGEQMWDYLYCEDAARALLLLAEKGKHGGIYPLGSGKVKALAEYIYILRDAINPNMEIGLGEIPYGPKQVMYLCADTEAIRRDTGFEPVVSFEEGIKRTISWVQHEGE